MCPADDGPGGQPPPRPPCAICGKDMSQCPGHTGDGGGTTPPNTDG